MSRLFIFAQHHYPYHSVEVLHTRDGCFVGFTDGNSRFLTEDIVALSGTPPPSVAGALPFTRSWQPKHQAYTGAELNRSGASVVAVTTHSNVLQDTSWTVTIHPTTYNWTERRTLSNAYTQTSLYNDWKELLDAVDFSNTTIFPRNGLTSLRQMSWVGGVATLAVPAHGWTGGSPVPFYGIDNVTEMEAGYEQHANVIYARVTLIRAPGIRRVLQWLWPAGEFGGFPPHPYPLRDYGAATLSGSSFSDVLTPDWVVIPLSTTKEPDVPAGHLVAKSTQLQFWRT
jgi:hypothetical protein